jgi:predicted dehydrogenase
VIGVQLANNRIGIIGFGNHTSRIISILEKISNVEIYKIFHPTKIVLENIGTNQLDDLYDCDCILILSPDDTHFEYLSKLSQNYNGYIFCEKPIVTKLNELKKLENINEDKKKKIFFNFNFRFSKLSDIIKKEINDKKIGEITHINIVSTHGLAFKKEYLDSWRSDKKKNHHNILDSLAIHYLDLILFQMGSIKNSNYYPRLVSKNGDSYDTCRLTLETEHASTIIYCSYANPKINEIVIIGTNGYITIRDNKKEIFYPRDSFNEKGFFIKPPMIENEDFNFEDEYINSLKKSLEYFINIVKNKELINLENFEKSIITTKLLIEIKK